MCGVIYSSHSQQLFSMFKEKRGPVLLGRFIALVFIIALLFTTSCKQESSKNTVDFDQINVDESTDYNYIFKDIIQQQEKEKQKYKKNPFK